MDLFTQIFLTPILIFFKTNWWIIPLILLLFYLKRNIPKLRGMVGEARVRTALAELPENDYTTIHDLLLEAENGTAQIDHIVVSAYGIFVIETKNYTGAIYGKYRDRRWTAVHGGSGRTFMNPIHQNFGHLKAVERALDGEYARALIPIVVFADGCKLCLTLEDDAVVHICALKAEIRRHREILFTLQEARRIAERLRLSNIPGRAARRAHLRRVGANKA